MEGKTRISWKFGHLSEKMPISDSSYLINDLTRRACVAEVMLDIASG